MANEIVPIGSGKVPAPIRHRIEDMLAAFATNLRRDDDLKVRLRGLYLDAIAGFDASIVDAAMQRLLFNNPRNPFHPTPQDVRDACTAIAAEQHRRYIAGLAPRLRDARERVLQSGWWGRPEAEIVAEAERLLAEEDDLRRRCAARSDKARAVVSSLLKKMPEIPE